ncbi:MAG: hypothetical protein R3C59_29520 [Planctomycetaceae bacterium]
MQSSAPSRRTLQEDAPAAAIDSHPVDHWLFDSERLITWQGELVNCCDAINRQLNQIRTGLNSLPTSQDAERRVASLRIVAE